MDDRLAAAGILPRVLAAVAMATSSVTVVGNALRLAKPEYVLAPLVAGRAPGGADAGPC